MNCKVLIVFINLICALTHSAIAQSFFTQEMLRIDKDNQNIETLDTFRGTPLITSFFMPKCTWCQRQHKVLKDLSDTCAQIKTVLLGVQGTKHKLKKALKRKKNNFPAYLANRNIINAIGTKSPVPMMLVFNAQGKLVFKTIGFTAKDKLLNLLVKNNVATCLI